MSIEYCMENLQLLTIEFSSMSEFYSYLTNPGNTSYSDKIKNITKNLKNYSESSQQIILSYFLNRTISSVFNSFYLFPQEEHSPIYDSDFFINSNKQLNWLLENSEFIMSFYYPIILLHPSISFVLKYYYLCSVNKKKSTNIYPVLFRKHHISKKIFFSKC